jgi:hypothetical protein
MCISPKHWKTYAGQLAALKPMNYPLLRVCLLDIVSIVLADWPQKIAKHFTPKN